MFLRRILEILIASIHAQIVPAMKQRAPAREEGAVFAIDSIIAGKSHHMPGDRVQRLIISG